MLPSANRYTALLDACVLFPAMKRDLLLRFFEADLYRSRWTDEIQQELLKNAKTKYPDKASNFDRVSDLMFQHFDSAWIPRESYEQFKSIVSLPDENDEHVLAAAIACGANYLVTDNIKDFPEQELNKFGIEAGTADMFLSSAFDHYRDTAFENLRAHRTSVKGCSSASEYIMQLRSKGLPRLASRVQPMIAYL